MSGEEIEYETVEVPVAEWGREIAADLATLRNAALTPDQIVDLMTKQATKAVERTLAEHDGVAVPGTVRTSLVLRISCLAAVRPEGVEPEEFKAAVERYQPDAPYPWPEITLRRPVAEESA